MTPRVVVVGGGISGLATAFHLRTLRPDRPPEVVLLEGRDRAGGNVRTDTDGGCVREHGPNGFLDNVPETLDLARALGLTGRLRRCSDAAARRFLWRRGALHAIPSGPGALLLSPLLSVPGRLRVLLEPFARGPRAGDETVFDFAARRIGREAAAVLVDAMVAGVFAGDARTLSLRSAFPAMWAMEREHGSLFRALRAKRREAARSGKDGGGPAGPGGVLHTFDGGMQVLTDALAARLGPAVRTAARATALSRRGDGWCLRTSAGEAIDADAVVLAVPAFEAAALLAPLAPRAAAPLGEIRGAPVAVVSLLYPEAAAPRAREGFGFLVPAGEGPRVLGVLWDSTIFEGRAPAGMVHLRAMAGGARAPDLVDLSDPDLLALVREDLRRTMGVTEEPVSARVYRHAHGIPQYRVGHGERLRAVEEALAPLPGLHLTGNSYRGVSMNLCCRDALATARAVLGRIG